MLIEYVAMGVALVLVGLLAFAMFGGHGVRKVEEGEPFDAEQLGPSERGFWGHRGIRR